MSARGKMAGVFAGALAGVGTLVALAGPWSFSPMHQANLRSFEASAAKVERFCGPVSAQAFRETHDPDDDSVGPMRDWVRRCRTGER